MVTDIPLETSELPPIDFFECDTYEQFYEKRKQLEADGYTYFGNTADRNSDGSCFTNAEEYMGPIPHPLYAKYKLNASDRLRCLAAHCYDRGEYLVTTTGYNIFSGDEVEDSKGVFIQTREPTFAFSVRETLKITKTVLDRAQCTVLSRLRRLVSTYSEQYDSGHGGGGNLMNNIRLPFGYGLKNKQRIIDDLEQTLRTTEPVSYEQEPARAQLIAEIHECTRSLLTSVMGKQED